MYDYQIETLFLINQLNQLKTKVDEYEATIDYLQRINEQLSENSKLLNIVVSNSKDLILRHAPDGEILFASPSSLILTGYLASELLGKNIYNLVYHEDIPEFESILNKQISLNSLQNIRFRIHHKHKGIVWVESKRKVLQRNNSEIYKEVINWISDISDEVKREESIISLLKEMNSKKTAMSELSDHQSRTIMQLKMKEQDYKELNKLNSRILSIVAHDLKNPFNSLQSMTEMYMENHESLSADDLNSVCESVHYSVIKANTLLDNLLTWSQNHTDNFNVEINEIELNELLEQCWKIYSPSIQRKQIEIVNLVSKSIFINSDQNILATIIRNIISNAIKYSSVNGKIFLNYSSSNQYDIISIKDEGIGMSRDEVLKLNSFSSIKSKLGTMNEKGSGLGLLMVSELLPKLNGILHVESNEDIGSTFEIMLLKRKWIGN